MEWAELLSGILVFVILCVALAIFVFACIGIIMVYSNYKDSKWQKEYGNKLKEETERNEWGDMERLTDKAFLLEETIKANGLANTIDKIDIIISDVNYDARYNDYRKNEAKWKVFALSSMAGGFGSSENAKTDIQEDFEKYEKRRKQELREKLDGIKELIMEIEQKAKKWFDETMDLLESRFPNGIIKNDLEDTVNSSVTIVSSYASSIFCVLEGGEDLPAMALLRSLYQFTSRLTWILIGSDDSDRRGRLECLEKKSHKDELKLINGILDVFKNDKRESTIEALSKYGNDRVEIEERIEELDKRNVEEMPGALEILKEAFGGVYGQPDEGPDTSGTIPIAAWARLNKAVHPDYTILKSTVTNSTGCRLYDGRVNEDVDGLRYECCVCIHRFLKEIYKFYDFNFQTIDKEFAELGNMIINK